MFSLVLTYPIPIPAARQSLPSLEIDAHAVAQPGPCEASPRDPLVASLGRGQGPHIPVDAPGAVAPEGGKAPRGDVVVPTTTGSATHSEAKPGAYFDLIIRLIRRRHSPLQSPVPVVAGIRNGIPKQSYSIGPKKRKIRYFGFPGISAFISPPDLQSQIVISPPLLFLHEVVVPRRCSHALAPMPL
jgi:hypothetical protein